MLSAEQTFFLTVLADHLNGRPTNPVSGLEWNAVYDMAIRHQVSAIFYAQCGAFLPPEAELSFLRDYGAAVADYAARRKIFAELDRAFTLHKIPYVIVKGFVVAESYPQPELRTMGDIDIIVHEADKEKAHNLFVELGFRNTQKEDHEWVYWKDRYEIELHHRLLYDETPNLSLHLAFADRMWEYVHPVPDSSRCELDAEFHFVFLAMHLKKHVVLVGVGFRQFMDLAVTAGKWSLNWTQMEKWLNETEMTPFVQRSLIFCRKWFQLSFPFAEMDTAPEFELETTQQIFCNGVFGFDNNANKDNWMIAQMETDGGDSLYWRLQKCLKTILLRPTGWNRPWAVLFPGYESLRSSRNYSFVDKRPWLVPVAWIYRFVYCIWFKISYSREIMLFSRKKVRERNDTLKKMGL